MDDLSYLIIESGINDAYYNSASLANGYPRDHRFIGHMPHHVENKFGRLIEEGLFDAVAGQRGNYYLSEKGKKAYQEEQAKRQEKVIAEQLQKSVSESVIQTNASVSETNESVRQTNSSVQELNRISTANFKVQNRLTISSILVATFAALIALGSLFQGIFGQGNVDVLRQLQETNKHLQEQNNAITKLLSHQVAIDSIIRKKAPDTVKRK